MDRAYLNDIPRHRKVLMELRLGFSRIETDTDWLRLRVDPLLRHVKVLERLLQSPRFSSERSRLRNGVSMFHSDLVYLRENIKTLKAVLAKEMSRRKTGKENEPNKAMERSRVAVTDRAGARSAPSTRLAHLGR